MKRIFRNAMTAAVLLTAACMKDGPVSPNASQVSLHVQFQAGTPGTAVQVTVMSIVSDSTEAFDTLFNGTFPVTTGSQQVTAAFDLTSCLARQASEGSSFCTVEVELALLNNGQIVDQQFLGEMEVRPGQVVQTQPVVLTAGNNPPTITATDTARVVESGLIRFHIAGSDPDGDLTLLESTDIADTVFDLNTPISFYPPLRTLNGYYYAFQSPIPGATSLQTFLSDSKFNSSQPVTMPVSVSNGNAFVDSMIVDTTADSLIINVRSTADSAEIVVRNVVNQTSDSLYFVCGGSAQPQGVMRRYACARQVPFTQAIAIVVPIDAAGNAGQGERCSVPNTACLPPFLPDRVPRRRQ